MPTYPHDMFSVARGTNGGAAVTFKKEDSHMITKSNHRFDFHESDNLIYLPTVEKMSIMINVMCATTCKLGMKFLGIAIMRMCKNYRVW